LPLKEAVDGNVFTSQERRESCVVITKAPGIHVALLTTFMNEVQVQIGLGLSKVGFCLRQY
jgi:hypothetical protein